MKYLKDLELNFPIVGLFVPVSIIAVPLALAKNQISVPELETQFAIGIFATLIASILLAIQISLQSIQQKSSVFWWFGSLIIIGVIRGYVISTLARVMEMNDPAKLGMRMANSALTTVFWVTLFAMIINSSKEFRNSYRNQIMFVLHNMAASEYTYNRDLEYLREQVENVKKSANSFLNSPGLSDRRDTSIYKIRSQLLSQIDEVLRPMSYRIWKSDPFETPRLKLSIVIKVAFLHLRYSPALVLALLTVTGFVNGTSIFGVKIAAVRLLIVASSWLVIHLIYMNIAKSREEDSAAINVVYLFIAGWFPMIISEFLNKIAGDSYNFKTTVLLAPLLPVMMLSISMIKLISEDRKSVLELLSKLARTSKEEIEEFSNKRLDLAGYLHNSLQSELLAISMQLENAQTNSDEIATRETIENLHGFLSRVLKEDFTNHDFEIGERIIAIQNGWLGIAEVSINLVDTKDLTIQNQIKVIQTCQEVITNSIRHGGSTAVFIEGFLSKGVYQISMVSNGQLNLTETKDEGMSWLGFLTENTWKVSKVENGVTGSGSISLI